MKLIRIKEPSTEAGEYTTTWALTIDQYHVLLNYAINDLVMKGLIEVSDLSKEEVEDLQNEMDKDVVEAFSDFSVGNKTLN